MSSTAFRLSAYSRLFSSTVFRELAANGRSALFARLLKESLLVDSLPSNGRVRDAFDAAFATLQVEEFRDEHIYKTALTHKVLLGTHSLNSASMLNEFRVGSCKADLAILNGTSTVYEIKSERDSLGRLERQVNNYQKFFARVYVIAGENHIDAILSSVPNCIGVMQLSKRQQITTIRVAANEPDRICPVTVFDSIRISEAIEILRQLGLSAPSIPNTMLHAELRQLFSRLRPLDVHNAMVQTLKKTRDLAPLAQLLEKLPSSLHVSALSLKLKKTDHNRLVKSVNTSLSAALNWA